MSECKKACLEVLLPEVVGLREDKEALRLLHQTLLHALYLRHLQDFSKRFSFMYIIYHTRDTGMHMLQHSVCAAKEAYAPSAPHLNPIRWAELDNQIHEEIRHLEQHAIRRMINPLF